MSPSSYIENEDSSAYATFSSTFTDTAFVVDRYGYRKFAQFLDRKFQNDRVHLCNKPRKCSVQDRVRWPPL